MEPWPSERICSRPEGRHAGKRSLFGPRAYWRRRPCMRVNTVSACTIITPRVEAALNRCLFKTATSQQRFSRVVLTALHSIDARSRPASRRAVTPVSSCAPSVGSRSTVYTLAGKAGFISDRVRWEVRTRCSYNCHLPAPLSTASGTAWESTGATLVIINTMI